MISTEYSRPREIFRKSDQAKLAIFPEGLFKNSQTRVKILYDDDYAHFWKSIEAAGGVRVSDLAAKSYTHLKEPRFVPFEDPYFALAFFQDHFLTNLNNPSLGWRYTDIENN